MPHSEFRRLALARGLLRPSAPEPEPPQRPAPEEARPVSGAAERD